MSVQNKKALTNAALRRRLLVDENILVIEDILNREAQCLERLQKLKEAGKLNFGQSVSSRELQELVPEVCASVDSFLGIQNGNVPRVGMYFGFSDVNLILALLSSASSVHKLVTLLSPNYDGYLVTDISSVIAGFLYLNHSSYYNSLTKHIVMERGVRAIFIPVLAHEYAHVVQQRKGIISPCGGYLSYPIFREGHARGVQRYVAEAYCQKEDNEAYLYDISQTTVAELKRAYIWMCKQLGTQVHNSLLRVKSEKDCLEERMWISLGGKPSSHAIGNAFFLVLEAQKDRTIYQTVLI